MYLLVLSKYLAYEFIWRSFTYNGDGKALPLCLYLIKYLNKSLPYNFLWDNTISSISTLSVLMGFLFLWKTLLVISFSLKYAASCLIFYTRGKKVNIFYFNF